MRLPRCVVCTAAGLAMALSALPARAAGEPPRPPQSALNKLRDLSATVKARRLLQDDPALARLNLGVEVSIQKLQRVQSEIDLISQYRQELCFGLPFLQGINSS